MLEYGKIFSTGLRLKRDEEDEAKDAMSIVNLLQENLDMWNNEGDEEA